MKINSSQLRVPKLRFKEFSGEWEDTNIGSILKIGSGKDYKHLKKGSIPVFGTGGYMLSVNDYLYEGASVCIGRKGTIDKPTFINGKFWTVDTLFYTHRFNKSIPKFIFNIFQTICWQNYNEASGVPSLSKKTIEKIKVKIPATKPEQQKIASFLTSVDKKIELLTQKEKLLKDYKKSLMQKIFSKEIRFKDDGGSKFPEWEKTKLKDISKLITKGTTPKYFSEEGITFIKIEGLNGININKDKCLFIDEKTHNNELKRSTLEENDILFAIAGTIGKVGFVRKDILPANTNQALSIVRLSDTDYLYFVLQVLQSNTMKKYIQESISLGAQPNLNLQQMGDFTFNLPTKPEQQKIASFLTSVDKKIEQVAKQLEHTKEFKKGLLQQMFM